jgi:Flp pilus assembly protein TadG
MDMVRKRKKAWRRGTTAVEAAIVFPLLLLVTLGAIQYGWLFLKAQQITNAARAGARIAILPDVTVIGDVEPAISSLMTAAGMGASGYTVTVTPGNPASLGPGQAVTVRITVPGANIDIMGTGLLPTPANLTAAVTMAKEGP